MCCEDGGLVAPLHGLLFACIPGQEGCADVCQGVRLPCTRMQGISKKCLHAPYLVPPPQNPHGNPSFWSPHQSPQGTCPFHAAALVLQVEDCDLASFHVHAGDIIVMGSDGLMDNLAELDIMTEVGADPPAAACTYNTCPDDFADYPSGNLVSQTCPAFVSCWQPE